LSASLGLTDHQREFQKVASEFAKNELAPKMQEWDQEVCSLEHFCLVRLMSPLTHSPPELPVTTLV